MGLNVIMNAAATCIYVHRTGRISICSSTSHTMALAADSGVCKSGSVWLQSTAGYISMLVVLNEAPLRDAGSAGMAVINNTHTRLR